MSCESTAWALDVKALPHEKLLLIILSDCCGMDGVATASNAELIELSSLTEAELSDAIAGLIDKGLMRVSTDYFGEHGWLLGYMYSGGGGANGS